MESNLLFEKIILAQMEHLPLPTEDIFEEENNFANEIFMKFVDESPDIDLYAEMEHDEETYLPSDLQWISDKIDLPINDFVESIQNADDIVKDDFSIENMEFSTILNATEFSNGLTTPPQSPPEHFDPSLQIQQVQQYASPNIPNGQQYDTFDYQQQISSQQEQYFFVQNATVTTPLSGNDVSIIYENSNQSMISNEEVNYQEIVNFDPDSIISSPADIQRELEVVDELVRAHSRNNSDYDDDNSVSAVSSIWSPRSEYSSSGYSQFDDEPAKKSSSGLRGVTKKRKRGYGRNPEEKKFRKKEQNKNAATRYRMKKKQEVEVIMDEEKILADKNRKLSTTYKDTKREVKYLKSLLRELFQARGFI